MTATDTKHLFEKCISRKSGTDYEINCLFGLWGVTGADKDSVESEAWRYWVQYYRDGEYDKHLKS